MRQGFIGEGWCHGYTVTGKTLKNGTSAPFHLHRLTRTFWNSLSETLLVTAHFGFLSGDHVTWFLT